MFAGFQPFPHRFRCFLSATTGRYLPVQHSSVQVHRGHGGVRVSSFRVPPARRCRESTNCTFCPQRRGSSQFHLLQSLHRHSISGQQPGQTRSGSGWKTEARRHQLGLQHAVGVARSRRGGAPLSAADGSVFDRLGEGASKEILGIIVSYKVKVKLVVSRGGSVTFTNTFLSRTMCSRHSPF